jgi:hypothetical protein
MTAHFARRTLKNNRTKEMTDTATIGSADFSQPSERVRGWAGLRLSSSYYRVQRMLPLIQFLEDCSQRQAGPSNLQGVGLANHSSIDQRVTCEHFVIRIKTLDSFAQGVKLPDCLDRGVARTFH